MGTEIMDTEMNPGSEKRRVFRLELKTPLCVDLSITYLNDLPVQSGYTKVCAVNLSAIGFSFVTKLSFPVKSGVLYNFKTKILDEPLEFTGSIMWKRTYGDIHRYGVQFVLDEKELQDYIQIFNRFAQTQRKFDEPLKSCSYCTEETYPCK